MLLITGITSHSGKYFFNELVKNKVTEKIKIIFRNEETLTFIKESGLDIEVLVDDLSNESFLTKSLENVDTLFHIASILYSENVVKAAVTNKLSRIIVVHTTGIYSQFKSASEEYKLIETNVNNLISNASHTIDFTILRPTMIFGYLIDRNMIKFIKLVDKLPFLSLINYGKSLIQPVHGKYLDKRIFFINVPNRIGVFFAQLLKLISLNKIDYVERVQRMSENRSFSYELATRDFNYSPSLFNNSLKDEVQMYLSEKETKI